MLHSTLLRPVCEVAARPVRLHRGRAARWTVKQGGEKVEKVPWLSRTVGVISMWMHGARVEASQAARSGSERKGLLSIFADHCGFVTGQRLRRAWQIGELYSNLYSERTRRALVSSIWRRFQSKHAPTGKLFAAMAGIFIWDKERVQDEEIHRFEASLLFAVQRLSALCVRLHLFSCDF